MSQQSNPATLREALSEARKVIVVACGDKAPYVKVALARIDAALAASGTEAAPSVTGRDVSTLSHESLKYLVPPKLHRPAQAAASPEGEGRRPFVQHECGCEQNGEVIKPCDRHLEFWQAALRQSAAPSGGAAQVTLQMLNLALAKSRWTGPFDPEIAVHELNKLLAQESKTGAVTETK